MPLGITVAMCAASETLRMYVVITAVPYELVKQRFDTAELSASASISLGTRRQCPSDERSAVGN